MVINYDHGAEKFIEQITVKQKANGEFESVDIKTKSYFQNAPILTYMGHEKYAYIAKKIDSYVWRFKLSSFSVVTQHPTHTNHQCATQNRILDILFPVHAVLI